MKTVQLTKDGETLIETVELATGLWDRIIGLLGRSSLGQGRAMCLASCNCVHTFFMKFNLDLVFLSRDLEVKKIVRNVSPNRVVAGGTGTRSVLEMESGWFPEDALNEGDRISFSCDY